MLKMMATDRVKLKSAHNTSLPLVAVSDSPATVSTISPPLTPSKILLTYLELAKPRILVMIILTAMAGYGLALRGEVSYRLLWHMSWGIMLLGAGVAALNQFFERETDRAMRRTENRPLPTGRVTAKNALYFGGLTSLFGLGHLAVFINPLTALLGLFTLISYVFIYTPLKRRSSLSTVVGAFPGAMPPLLGWATARGELDITAITLFLIMLLWQFPHFLAIAWMYREDYARAGIRMLPVIESSGQATSRQILLYSLALIPVSLLPTLLGLAGLIYFIGALLLGIGYFYVSVQTALQRTGQQAKRLLQVSILYLPLLFILMLLDKLN
jgi:heme o synthase